MKPKNLMFKLSLLALCMAWIVVVLGAFTRLVDAGLGCPDWPTCYGHMWVPNESHEIASANERFEDTPVETDKTWPEQIHRIFASSLGLVILAIFFVAYKARNPQVAARSIVSLLGLLVAGVIGRIIVGDALDPLLWLLVALYFLNLFRLKSLSTLNEQPLLLPASIAGLVILQGFFGMWTVTLKLWPQVVTAHLLGGFATLSLIWLLLQRSAGCVWSLPAPQVVKLMQLRKLALIVLCVVVVQIALGGWTSSNYAALACPDFPTCQNALIPQADFSQGFNLFQKLGPNYLGGLMDNHARVAIHFSHRIGALVVTALSVWFIILLLRVQSKKVRKATLLFATVLIAQILLGISNIVLALPLAVAVFHNAVGALLLLVLVMINHRIATVKTL